MSALAAAMLAYAERIAPPTTQQRRNLQRLAGGAQAVVAGQQAGLLTGPAYAVHKAADAALLAAELSRGGQDAVPVFWIASQDHDTAEVCWATLMGHDGTLRRLELPLPAGVPVGRVAWQPDWTEMLAQEIAALDYPAAHREAGIALLRRAAGGSYADTFARLMQELLGDSGLLLFDPMAPELAPFFKEGLRRELSDPFRGPESIEEAAREQLSRGVTPALRRAEGSTNLFLEEDGQRRLLRASPGGLSAGREYAVAELLDILEADPARITPAAGLRPALQVGVLPTAALVVGPGEQAYLSQLEGVFAAHGLSMPPLHTRLSVTWLEPPIARILARYGLSAAEFTRDPEGSLGAALAARSEAARELEQALARAEAAISDVSGQLVALDPGLRRSGERLRGSWEKRARRLQGQARRALLQQQGTGEAQFGRLSAALLPFGKPQERELSFFSLLLGHGRAPLRALLALPAGTKAELNPAEPP